MLLGLERLLVQAPDMKIFTYSRVPESSEPDANGDGQREVPIWHLDGDESPGRHESIRVALLSDRRLPDVVGDVGALLESADEVVLLASRPDIGSLLGAMAAGARSFVMEGDPPETLVAAVRAAARGRTYMGQRTMDLLVDWLAHKERVPAARSARERDDTLLRLLAEGRTTADIAADLGLAPKTVRNRASMLYRRLGVRSRAAAVRLAEERGMLDQK